MPVLRAISWNIARRTAAYNALDGAVFDVALHQESVLATAVGNAKTATAAPM